MSSATELFASRIGGARGQHGAQGLTTTWHIVVDAIQDDPVTVLNLAAGGVTLGSIYPWEESFGVIAIAFSIRDRLAPLSWLIDVIYGVPLVAFPPVGLPADWTWEGGSSLEQEEYEFDVADAATSRESKAVGIPGYRIAAPPDLLPYPFRSLTKDAEGNAEEVNLILTGSNKDFHATPLTRNKAAAWLSATKTVSALNVEQLSLGFAAVSKTNDAVFLGADINQVLVTGFTWRPVPVTTSQGFGATGFEIRFDFSVNQNLWTDVRVDTFGSGGNDAYIKHQFSEELVTEEFFPYETTSISSLLGGYS